MRSSRLISRPVAAVVVACVLAAPVAAQAPDSTAVISGKVRRAPDSLPVSFARVTLDSAGAAVSTDSAGLFILRRVAPGTHVLHVERIGYVPAHVNVVASRSAANRVSVMLEPLAQRLVTVEINGRKVDVPWRFAGIANRVRLNHGALFTADDVSPLDRTRDVFLSLPGVHVNDRSLTFARCQDSGRIPGFFDTPGPRDAKVQLYIDGVHVNIEDVSSAIDEVNPASVQVIEVYTGIGRIPAEYVADACAVIAIWTKSY